MADTTTTLDMWQQIVVQSAGPLITVVGGGIAAGLIAQRHAERQTRQALRIRLAKDTAEIGKTLYFDLQTFWRAAEKVPLDHRSSSPELAPNLESLRTQYEDAIRRGNVLEEELRIYFRSPEPARMWHQCMSRLTVRYLLLVVSDGPRRRRIRKQYAGHAGLNDDQMKDPTQLLKKCREALDESTRAIWRHPIDLSGPHPVESYAPSDVPEDRSI